MQSPLPSRHLLARLGSQWQVSRRPLARGCFAGRSLVFRPSLSGSLHFATSSRPPAAPFAVETRPPCASSVPLSGQPRPAGHGFQSLPFASSLRSFHPRPRAGIRSGVGVAWAQPCTCGDLFWVHPHACAIRSFFLFVPVSEVNSVKRPHRDPGADPSFPPVRSFS
jgi:hypothetical protein